MSTVQVKVSQRVVTKALSIKPDYDTNAAHLSRLLEMGIAAAVTLNSPSAQARGPWGGGDLKEEDDRAREELINRPPTPAPKAPKDPWTLKKVSPSLVPEELDSVAEKFVEWWEVRAKGAVRTSSVAKREFSKLLAWDAKDRAKALEKAIASGWKQLYVPEDLRPTQGQYSAPEPSAKHPAYRDAGDVIAESKRLAQQNVEHLRRKKQEEEEAKAGNGVLAGFDL